MAFRFVLRLLCLTGLAACSIAVAVARCAPREANFWLRSDPHTAAVNGSFFRPAQPGSQVLDTASGALGPLPAPRAETVQWPAFSDWADADGERQVVGLWVVSHGNSTDRLLDEAGLARLSYPSGRVLNRVANCPIPRRNPCWYPGPKPRVLYAATDGQLYQCAFGSSEQPEVKAVSWPLDADRDREPHVESVIWPDTPVLKGGVIAVVNQEEPSHERGPFRFWWIKLNPDGTQVVAAAKIALTAPDTDESANWHAPSVHRTPSGDWVVAWLRFKRRSRVAELLAAPLRADAHTGAPTIVNSELRTLGDGMLGMPPAFSPDGRWVYGVQESPGKDPVVQRFSLSAPRSDGPASEPPYVGD